MTSHLTTQFRVDDIFHPTYGESVFTSLFFLQAVLLCGRTFIDEGHSSSDDIKARCDQLQENWDELKNLAEQRCVCVGVCGISGKELK